ncbi:hypothetical protein ACR0ST_10280 [Aliidiomarina sp. Khilg15.8]
MLLCKGVSDEQLILNSHGMQIDVARLIDHINANEDLFTVLECSTQRLMDVNRADGINRDLIASMESIRVEQPVLVANIDGYEWIIDGNHRLLKRHELRKEHSFYIPVKGSELELFVSKV